MQRPPASQPCLDRLPTPTPPPTPYPEHAPPHAAPALSRRAPSRLVALLLGDDLLVSALLPHRCSKVKPRLKVVQRGEDVGQQKVEQRPQLGEVVLQRGACARRGGAGEGGGGEVAGVGGWGTKWERSAACDTLGAPLSPAPRFCLPPLPTDPPTHPPVSSSLLSVRSRRSSRIRRQLKFFRRWPCTQQAREGEQTGAITLSGRGRRGAHAS